MQFSIRPDDLSGPEIRSLLEAHLALMRSISPPESVHALDLSALREPGITFWTAWDADTLAGCGALKVILLETERAGGEVKSMHTAAPYRKRGVAEAMLNHILDEARTLGLCRLSLETGSQPAFEPARRLYAKHGFALCGPFGDYGPDPNSVFMTRSF